MREDYPPKVIISLKDTTLDYSSDVELPSEMPIKDLSTGLIRLLRTYEPRKYAGCTSVDLWFGDEKLKDEQTLASIGAWDGSELTLRVTTGRTVFGKKK